MASSTSTSKRESAGSTRRNAPKRPCPHCGEEVYVFNTECVFCGRTVDFSASEKQRVERVRTAIQSVRVREKQAQRKGSIGTGILVGALAAVIFGVSLTGLVLAPHEVSPSLAGVGILMGVTGFVFAVHNLFTGLKKS